MEQSMILDIYYNNQETDKKITYSKRYIKANGELKGAIDNLEICLKKHSDILELYYKLIDLFCDVEYLSAECHYEEGFKTGFRFALEVLGFKAPFSYF